MSEQRDAAMEHITVNAAGETTEKTPGENSYVKEVLLPRLKELQSMLEDAGVRCEPGLGEEEIPGLFVLEEEWPPLFIAFLEGEDDVPDCLRFTAEITGGTASETKEQNEGGAGAADGEPDYARFLVPADEAQTAEELLTCVRLFFAGRTMHVYPTAGQLDGTEVPEDIELIGAETLSDGSEAAAEHGSPADGNEAVAIPEAYTRLLPRTQALLAAVRESYMEDCALMDEGLPGVLCVDGDFSCVLAYEQTGDNSYLLHFRADVPLLEAGNRMEAEIRTRVDAREETGNRMEAGDPAAFCRMYNRRSLFVRAEYGHRDLSVYGDTTGEDEDPLITFHACIPDNGSIKGIDRYEWLLSMFEDDVMEDAMQW